MEFVGEARKPAMNHPPVDDDEEENVDDTEEENRELEWRKNGSMISKSGGSDSEDTYKKALRRKNRRNTRIHESA
ncbi:hypothetical protein ACET3Z_012057 [Daucus carota]